MWFHVPLKTGSDGTLVTWFMFIHTALYREVWQPPLLWNCVLIKNSIWNQLCHRALISKYLQVCIIWLFLSFILAFCYKGCHGKYKAIPWSDAIFTCKCGADDCPHYWGKYPVLNPGIHSQVPGPLFVTTLSRGADCPPVANSLTHWFLEVHLWPATNEHQTSSKHFKHYFTLSFAYFLSLLLLSNLFHLSRCLLYIVYAALIPAGNNEEYN